MAYTLEHYETEDGKTPMNDFLLSLPPKLRAKVVSDETVLREIGSDARPPLAKHLDDGIFELRSKQSSNIVRSLFFFRAGRRIVVTHGFVKKSNKTPRGEIDRAKRYREDWIRRFGNEQLR